MKQDDGGFKGHGKYIHKYTYGGPDQGLEDQSCKLAVFTMMLKLFVLTKIIVPP